MKSIYYGSYTYWYVLTTATTGDMCLATTNPDQYCNGLYRYSGKDPGSGLVYVVKLTNDPAYIPRFVKRLEWGDTDTCLVSHPDYTYIGTGVDMHAANSMMIGTCVCHEQLHDTPPTTLDFAVDSTGPEYEVYVRQCPVTIKE